MAELQIPPEYQSGFVQIRQLDEEQVQDLVSALEVETPTVNRTALRLRIASKIDTIARGDLDLVINTLVSLYTVRESLESDTTPDFVEDICEAMDESGVAELGFNGDEERDSFKDRLVRLLGVGSLDMSAKANDLLNEHEHTVHGPMRILTDIRPIFGTDPEDTLAEFIERHESAQLTQEINDVYDEELEQEDEEFLAHVKSYQARVLADADD